MTGKSREYLVYNKRVTTRFHIIAQADAGIVLRGTEVKSIRDRKFSIDKAYCKIDGTAVWLLNMHISKYPPAGAMNHAEMRKRKILLKKKEIRRFEGHLSEKGTTLIPIGLFISEKGLIKLTIAVVKARRYEDIRDKLRAKEMDNRLRKYKHKK